MKKSGKYYLWKGRKVKVFSTSYHYLGVWEYEKAVYIGHFGKRKLFTPLFKQGKKKIHGYSCWWIPMSEAKKIEKKHDNKNFNYALQKAWERRAQ